MKTPILKWFVLATTVLVFLACSDRSKTKNSTSKEGISVLEEEADQNEEDPSEVEPTGEVEPQDETERTDETEPQDEVEPADEIED